MTRFHRILSSIPGLLLLAFSSAGYAQTPAGFTKLMLPESLDVAQRMNGPIAAGWEPFYEQSVPPRLEGVKIFDGHPREEFALVESKVQHDRFGTYARWTSGAAQRSFWVMALYASTNVTLVYALPRHVKEVRVYNAQRDKAIFYR